MSDPTFQTKVHGNHGGDRLTIESGGTIDVLAGGSVRYAAGAGFSADSVVAGTLSLGGTVGRWAFGSATLTSGTVPIFTGLGTVFAASITPVTAGINAGTGAGTATSFQIDLSRATNGTVFALGVTGTVAFTGAGTVTWIAMGR
jgi:hypothetical protein